MPAHPTIYAVFDENGCPQGFYSTPRYTRDTVPPEAIEIPYLAYLEFMEFQGARRWNGSGAEAYTPPTNEATFREPSPDETALINESIAIRSGISHAVTAWSTLENLLAALLGSIINQQECRLGTVLYYSPNATETRLTLVNDAIAVTCSIYPDGDRILKIWERINNAIDRCKSTRNKIVHGNISTFGTGKRNYTRLTQPLMNSGPSNKDFERLVQNTKKMQEGDSRVQMPGLSSNDIKTAAMNFSELANLCDKLRNVMIYLQTEGAEEPLRERLTALEADLQQRDDRSTGGRKRAKPPSPLQPSDQSPQCDG